MVRSLAIALFSGALIAAAPVPAADSMPARLLAAHNGERGRVKQPPLIWDDSLARDAAVWAKKLADTKSFEHDLKTKQGENLWAGTTGAYSPEDMVGLWIEERALFKNGKFPDVSTNGNWLDVGHYTQLIWHNTTHVGCATARNEEDDVLVCRYSPPGNWRGEAPLKLENVAIKPIRSRVFRKKE